ncbi:MAG: hypothetical protein HW387_116 [Parachlamydiales bacterium]|nr:hypothetical protein [Parachlamydiales bacterium]
MDLTTLNSRVEDFETIARFIFSSSEYRVSDQTVKHTAFLPARDMAASVYRIDGCSEDEISQIDQKYVSGQRTDKKVSKGRADILVRQVRKAQLNVISNPSPHPRHADIVGYSSEAENRMKAIELAQNAELVLKK